MTEHAHNILFRNTSHDVHSYKNDNELIFYISTLDVSCYVRTTIEFSPGFIDPLRACAAKTIGPWAGPYECPTTPQARYVHFGSGCWRSLRENYGALRAVKKCLYRAHSLGACIDLKIRCVLAGTVDHGIWHVSHIDSIIRSAEEQGAKRVIYLSRGL